MRQIKFRAYDKVEKKWLFDYEKLGGFSLIGEVTLMGQLNTVPIDQWKYIEIMQFTGLKDKNGVEIYEDDVIRVIGSMEDGKYKFDCQYRVNKMDYEGIKLSFIKLTNELPDSLENSFPISQSPSFYYGSLTTDYQNGNHNNLAFKDTFGENTLSQDQWKEHDYTNDIEVIGSIHTPIDNHLKR